MWAFLSEQVRMILFGVHKGGATLATDTEHDFINLINELLRLMEAEELIEFNALQLLQNSGN